MCRKITLGPDRYGHWGIKIKYVSGYWDLRFRHKEGLDVERQLHKRLGSRVFHRIGLGRTLGVGAAGERRLMLKSWG